MEGVVEKFGGGGDDDMVFEVGWGDKDPLYFGEWSSERASEKWRWQLRLHLDTELRKGGSKQMKKDSWKRDD